ncbi:RluA family pseudouridine synthase [Ignatzschineria cameli]|uniref:Pseudouridine synthase n=2 Tax=Ignatzschineria cameli TaxID=2182793 RepID=A0A2U2ARA7_9GAMM|nr:RluA family pseudouridine synthase [Ignatzschineria cameli]PWD89830.1 RluA family pseudouridine synthase [Ignatzschineria cameli]PWD91480.1 RluA family pseudouridine synthase [Ignatzschineria cameli]PWD92518.1 RluA family pseudouridine synthase [Ignatzschineria cameli]
MNSFLLGSYFILITHLGRRLTMSDNNAFEFIPATMVTITEHQETQRLDNFLLTHFKQLPKSRIYQMIRKGEVRINKGRAKPTTRLKAGDQLRLPPVKIEKSIDISIPIEAWQKIEKSIIFENDNFLIIDKPSKTAVHAGSHIPYGIIEILKKHGQHDFYELVQRLDRETSGLLMIAKNGKSLRALQETDILREYSLLVEGRWSDQYPDTITIDLPLNTENREQGERHVVVAPNGKEAITHFQRLQTEGNISLLKARLETGRTHQIRVHSAHIGFPLLGDNRYNPNSALKAQSPRLALHCQHLKFTLDGENYQFESPLPQELKAILNKIENK